MFHFHARHTVADNEHYLVVFDELRRERAEGFDQLLVTHIDFKQFTKQALARLLHEWGVFRSVVQAPLFAYCADDEAEPAKWERFVRLLGFEEVPNAALPAPDGRPRRIFVSYGTNYASKDNSNDFKHGQPVGPAGPVSDAGISDRSE